MTGSLPLFVYGTLQADGPAAALLRGLPRERAVVLGRLYALPAGYPAMVVGGEAEVHGELIREVDPRTLAVIDAYEGVGEGLYRRETVRAWFGLRQGPAWAYVMDDPTARGGRLLPGGRWRPTRGPSVWTRSTR